MKNQTPPPGLIEALAEKFAVGTGVNTRAEAEALLRRQAEDEYGENGRHARAILAQQCPAEM